MDAYELRVLGYVRSPLTDPADAPRQGDEGAPDAVLELDPAVEGALAGLCRATGVVVVTWLHLGDRDDAGRPPARRPEPPAHRGLRDAVAGPAEPDRAAPVPRSRGRREHGSRSAGSRRWTERRCVDVKIALGDVGDR